MSSTLLFGDGPFSAGQDVEDIMDPMGPLEDEEDRHLVFMPAVTSLVNALGGYEEVETGPGKYETIYRPGDSVLAVLKDLKKLWRKDDSDDERTVARCMAKAGLMKELIALLVECTDRGEWGRKVALVACDLIAALTWPIDVMQELKEMEDEPDVVTDYLSLLQYQVQYKAMIVQTNKPLRCILALLLPSLAKPRKDERDEKIISLGLHIVRNLLSIRDPVADGSAIGEREEFSNLQSALIVHLDQLTYFKLILTLASCAEKTEFNQYNVLVLDILYLIFRSVRPRDLGQDQARAPMENLSKLLDAEKRQKAMHSRVGMTRHSRFGTTVAVRAGDQRIVLHAQNAISADPGKILDDVKRKRARRVKTMDELARVLDLTPEALTCLQNLARTFIQSCFNSFFRSVLRDIRMERSKVRPTDNIRCFFLSKFFIEYFFIIRSKSAAKNDGKVLEGDDLSLGHVSELAEMDAVRWVVMRMKYAMEDKPPSWRELQASIDCFTQILLLIDAMATSEDEADIEAASVLQEKLYYNGDILDSCLLVVSQYKDQSIAYLDSIVHFAHVLLRMLEKYSKNKSYMFIRKRKAASRKKKAAEEGGNLPEDYGEDEEAGILEGDNDMPSYAEHAFTFQAFEKRFASEAVVNTLTTYLSRFDEFEDPHQMKRVVGLMHRQVVKTQAEGLYFKVSCLNLFRRVLDNQHILPKTESTRDLLHLVNYILRKFFKRVKSDPFVIVQAFAPKTRGHWKELSSYRSDGEEEEDGMSGQRARIQERILRAPAELEFKKHRNLSWSQQMGSVVAILLNAEKELQIQWIIGQLEEALAYRLSVVFQTDGPEGLDSGESDGEGGEDEVRGVRKFGGPSKAAMDKFGQLVLDPGDDEARKTCLAKDAHFRLMLKLLSFERTDEENAFEQKWFLPPSVVPSNISASVGALKQYLFSPPGFEDPRELLRRVRAPRPRRRRDSLDDSSGSDLDVPKRRRKAKAVETQIFKSAAFIDDSDDDEAADAAFFEKERRLRMEMNEIAEKSGHVMALQGKRKRKGKGKGKGKEKGVEEETQEDKDQSASEAGSDEEPLVVRRRSSPLLSDFGQSDASTPAATRTQTQRSKRVIASDSEDE